MLPGNGLFLGQEISTHRVMRTDETAVWLGPIGVCIYCGDKDDSDKLTIEHIIPSGIGGHLELLKSSCKKCAAITGRNEQKVLRDMFDVPRAKAGLRKRKHKDASQTARYQFIEGGAKLDKINEHTGEAHEMEFSKNPPDILPTFITNFVPGILLGLPETVKLPAYLSATLERDAMEVAFAKHGGRPGIDTIHIQTSFHAGRLAQMMAKIAHAYTVSQVGLGLFDPFLQQYIQERDDLRVDTHHIGAIGRQYEKGCIHEIKLFTYPTDVNINGIIRKIEYLLVRLQLFAWRNSVAHFVVVGKMKSAPISAAS